MSTYLPGVTDYIPQIQPFQPDYNYLGNVMQTRQSRYDVAHKQLSSVYGTLLNSPLTRDENISKRDQFFKSVDGDIKRMSGLDLSLKQNQDAAMQVFKPFYEDKDLVKDIVWTKNLHSELQRAEGFKYCVDPDKCGGQYWDGGVKALQYKAQEFKNASKEEALNMENASFTPLINVTDKAMKAAKDAGFKVSFDSVQGGYIVTDKNGERMVAPLKSFFLSKFGGDPAVVAYYKTLAYTKRNDFIAQNARQMGGEDKAFISYMNQSYGAITESINKEHERADKNHTDVRNLKDGFRQQVKEKGILPTDTGLKDMWSGLDQQEQITGGAKEVTTRAKNNLDAAHNFSNNAKAMGSHLDDLMAEVMLHHEVGNAAKAYADLTSERDLKADPYSLAAYTSSLSLKNMMAGKAADFEYWKAKEKIKAADKHAVAEREFQTTFNGGLPGSKGQATDVIDQDLALKSNQQMKTDLYNGKKAKSSEFLSELANELRTQYQNNAKNPTKQNVISTTADLAFRGSGIDGKKIAAGDNKEIAKLQNLDVFQASKAYEQAIKTVDPNAGATGQLNSDWGYGFWEKTADTREAIKDHDKLRGDFLKFAEKQSANVTNAVAGEFQHKDPVHGKQKSDLVKLMADLNHNGFLPDLTPGSSSANNIAHEYADKHERDFNNWQSAYSFALQNAEDVSHAWYNGYKNHAEAFNQMDGFGKISNAKMGGGYTKTYDSGVPTHQNTVLLSEVLNNTHAAEGEAIIQFGDAGTITGNDPAAKATWDQFYNDFNSVDLKHPEKNRPKGSYSIQRIGGGNENYMAYTIILDEKWTAQYKGSEKRPGITGGMVPGQPITVFIPKDKATNSFYKDTEFDIYDFSLYKGSGLQVENPMGGNIKIEKVGNQIMTHGNFLAYDEKGKEILIPVSKIDNLDTDASTWYDSVKKEMNNLVNMNRATLDQARIKYGVKDIEEFAKSEGYQLEK